MLYSEKAEQYPLLVDAIEGKVSVRGRLEAIVGQMDEAIGSPATSAELVECLEHDVEMLTTLGYLDAQPAAFDEGFSKEWLKGYLVAAIPAALLIFSSVSMMPAMLPALGATFISAGLGIGFSTYLGQFFQRRATLRQRRPFLDAVYQAAETLDADIAFLFPEVQFRKARPRFEENYRRMPAHRQEAVNKQLHAYLAAGGIRGMDEIQLNDYLSGLLVQETEGDA